MPGLGVEVEVRRGVSWRVLGGGSGSTGGRRVWAWAAMVHGLRGRLAGWRSRWCWWGCFRFLGFLVGWRRLRAAVLFRFRGLREAGSCLPGEAPAAAVPVSILLLVVVSGRGAVGRGGWAGGGEEVARGAGLGMC